MKLSLVLYLLAAFDTALSIAVPSSATVSGKFTIPTNLGDGSYILSIGADGKQSVEDITSRIDGAIPAPAPAKLNSTISSTLQKRGYNWPSGTYPACDDGFWMNEDDFYDHSFNTFWNGALYVHSRM